MAESAVSFLPDKLGILLTDEARLLKGVRTEVEFIKGELQHMKAFLRDADAKEETDEGIKVWVKQVRDVAYDTEDILDEFLLRFEHRHGQGFCAFVRKISCSIKNLKARHWIASEIQGVKSKVSDISQARQRYPQIVREEGSSSTTATYIDYESRGNALLLEEADLVGIDKPKNQLIQWLVDANSERKVFSVAGMGGLGKTTLVKKVYDDIAVKKHFQHHAWINVSQSFQLEELLKDMIQQLFSEIQQLVPQGVEAMNSQRLKTTINDFLRERRYLLVLDDVWRTGDWDAFEYAFPNSNCGSRVMLTTRNADVALRSSQGNVYKLKPLSPEESWTLFCRKTFCSHICPPHLVKLSESMLQRCEGLPLAIVAISGVLATKDESRVDEWEMVCRNLGDELEGDDIRRMNKILSLSYNDLPYYLKSCFLYLSIFPEDHLIEHMRLIRLWIAEGFVEEKGRKTPEDVAEGYLNQLCNRSLIQVAQTTKDGRAKLYRIHDLLREIIVSKSKDQNLIAGEQNRRQLEKVQRLSVYEILGNVEETKNLHRLRSLHMFWKDDSLSNNNSSVHSLFGCGLKLKLLKVLDLRGAPLDAFPNEITKLFHLRYLSLRNTKVKRVPNSIGKLQNLETLDLKGTRVTKLPVAILKLVQLRHLLVYHGTRGFMAPPRIGGLLSLQKLIDVEANHNDSGNLVEEIGRLTQLRRLGIQKLRRKDGATLCSSIEKLTELRSLSIYSIEKDEILDLQHLSTPPQFIRTLYLVGRLVKLPQWIPSLHSLVRVCLYESRLEDESLEYLGALPNLVELFLTRAYNGEAFYFKAGCFKRLKDLRVEGFERLRLVRVEEGSMPNLERLAIRRCGLLESVPSGIEHLTNLNILEFGEMPRDFIIALKQERDREGGDYWKLAHIPKVFTSRCLKGGDWILKRL